jgi:hypothetical protein
MPLNHTSSYADLTDRQYLLIGKLIIEFSNLEFLLGVLLSRLLITPEFLGRTYTDQIFADKIIKSIENALDIHNKRYGNTFITKKQSEEINDLIGEIKGFKNLRNKFAHFRWSRTNDEEIIGFKLSGEVLFDKKKQKDSCKISNSELQNEYEKSYNAVEKLQNIIFRLPELEEDEQLKSKLRIRDK